MKKLPSLVIIGIVVLGGLGAVVSGATQTSKSSPANDPTGITYEDELDQYMTTPDGALPVGCYKFSENATINLTVAQSFTPQKELLTRVQFLMGRNTTATYPCTLAIRENLTKEDLAVIRLSPDKFPVANLTNRSTLDWITFDIQDIWVTLGHTYYIVLYTANVSNNYYIVAGNGTNIYKGGSAFLSGDNGKTWVNFNNSDGCFKTYGLKETFLNITMESSLFGPSFIIKNVGNYTAWDVTWNITIRGGIFGRINQTSGSTLSELTPGNETTVKMGIFGLGSVKLSIRASAVNVHEKSLEINAMILFIFWIIK